MIKDTISIIIVVIIKPSTPCWFVKEMVRKPRNKFACVMLDDSYVVQRNRANEFQRERI